MNQRVLAIGLLIGVLVLSTSNGWADPGDPIYGPGIIISVYAAFVAACVVTTVIGLPYLAILTKRAFHRRKETGVFPGVAHWLKHFLILVGIFVTIFISLGGIMVALIMRR